MPSIRWAFRRVLATSCWAAAPWAALVPAEAQTCAYEVTTSAVVGTVTSIPTLSALGLLLLAVAIGVLARRLGGWSGARVTVVVLVAAAMLAGLGRGGLLDRAFAATVEILLSNAAGESITANVDDGDQVVLRNTSGVALRIAAIVPPAAACADGTLLLPAASCSLPVSCPLACGANEVDDNGVCVCAPGFVSQGGVCVVPSCGVNEVWDPLAQPPVCVCAPGYVRNVGGICVFDPI